MIKGRFLNFLQNIIDENLDRNLAIIGLVFSAIYLAFINLVIGNILYYLPGIITLSCCIIWLYIRNKTSFNLSILYDRVKMKFFFIIYILVFSLSILSIRFRPVISERPLIYFLFITLLAGTIIFQILYSQERHKCLIITQIILLGINIAWSQTLLYPEVMGFDPWYHMEVTMHILEQSTIIDRGHYSHFAIMHIFIALTSLLSDVGFRIAAMLSVGLVQIICNAVFIYLLAEIIFRNYKISLLAPLMLVTANYHISQSTSTTPNGFAVIFIPIVLYLILSTNQRNKELKYFVGIIISITLILTHPLAAMQMAVVLLAFYSIYLMYNIIFKNTNKLKDVFFFVFYIISMYSYWQYVSRQDNRLIGMLQGWEVGEAYYVREETVTAAAKYAQEIPIIEPLFRDVGTFLFFALSFIGLFYMISKNDVNWYSIATVAIIPLFISFSSLLGGGGPIIEGRWYYLAQILLAIPVAASVPLLFNTKNKNRFGKKNYFISAIILLIIFLLVMSPQANRDNFTFVPNSGARIALTESEMYTINKMEDIYNGTIGTDRITRYPFNFISEINAEPIDSEIIEKDFINKALDHILIRQVVQENVFHLFQTRYRLDYDIDELISRQGYAKTYNSKIVNVYSILF